MRHALIRAGLVATLFAMLSCDSEAYGLWVHVEGRTQASAK